MSKNTVQTITAKDGCKVTFINNKPEMYTLRKKTIHDHRCIELDNSTALKYIETTTDTGRPTTHYFDFTILDDASFVLDDLIGEVIDLSFLT